MQTITLTLDGVFKLEEQFEVDDAMLVTVISRLREVLQPNGAPAPKRRGRKAKAADDVTPNGEAPPASADEDPSSESEQMFR